MGFVCGSTYMLLDYIKGFEAGEPHWSIISCIPEFELLGRGARFEALSHLNHRMVTGGLLRNIFLSKAHRTEHGSTKYDGHRELLTIKYRPANEVL